MKTKAIIGRSSSGNFDFLTFSMLHSEGTKIKPYANIIWQGDNKYGWYGMRVETEVRLDEYAHLLTLYKILSYLKERCENQSPEEVYSLLGVTEHFYRDYMYVPVTDNGKFIFHVKNERESLEAKIISTNSLTARRALDGMIKRAELPDKEYKLIPIGSPIELAQTKIAY